MAKKTQKPTTVKSFEMNQTFINFQYYQVNANLIPKLWYLNFLQGNSSTPLEKI